MNLNFKTDINEPLRNIQLLFRSNLFFLVDFHLLNERIIIYEGMLRGYHNLLQ